MAKVDHEWLIKGVREDARRAGSMAELGLQLHVHDDGSFVLWTSALWDRSETKRGIEYAAVAGNAIEGENLDELQKAIEVTADELKKLATLPD